MRVINLFLFFLMLSPLAHSREETWGIYQFKKDLSAPHFLFFEYVRRDEGTFFENRFLDLYRFSYGGKINSWTYLIGGAYVDFEKTSDERRLHQFLSNQYSLSDSAKVLVRLGLEERSFISDENLYLRARLRAQVNYPANEIFGLAVYNEAFFALNGNRKYYQGFNENRFGAGLRFKSDQLEILLYQTFTEVRTLKNVTRPQWLQLQTVYNF